nr:hypothetical protein [uncultured Ruminococcus sp.]
MKKTQKIIIKRKGGVYSIKGNGDAYLMELANGAFRRGEMKPTFWQNVKRFFRCLSRAINEEIAECRQIARSTDTPAAEVPFIGLLEERVSG